MELERTREGSRIIVTTNPTTNQNPLFIISNPAAVR